MEALCKFLDKICLPQVVEKIWHLLVSVSILKASELSAAASVLGANAIRYDKVRWEGRFLSIVFKFMATGHLPSFMPSISEKAVFKRGTDIVVHELVRFSVRKSAASISAGAEGADE